MLRYVHLARTAYTGSHAEEATLTKVRGPARPQEHGLTEPMQSVAIGQLEKNADWVRGTIRSYGANAECSAVLEKPQTESYFAIQGCATQLQIPSSVCVKKNACRAPGPRKRTDVGKSVQGNAEMPNISHTTPIKFTAWALESWVHRYEHAFGSTKSR